MRRHARRVAGFPALGVLAAAMAVVLGAAPTAPAADAPATYMTVPVRGPLVGAVHGDGLKAVLSWASRSPRIGHVVLHIDSAGGSVAAAKAMLAHIRRERKRFTFHALVERAVGPAAAVALACDTVHVAPKAVLGGAGLTQAEAKALATEAAALALARKQPALLVQALFRDGQRLCAWLDADGRAHVDTKKPAGLPSGDLLVQHGGIGPLMLSADQADGLGLADGKADSIAALGKALDLDGWHSIGNYAGGVMRRLEANIVKRQQEEQERQEKLEKNRQQRLAIRKILEAYKEEAIRSDPRRYDYAVKDDLFDDDDGEMTSAARLQWRRNTEAAIDAWFRVQQAIRKLVELQKEAKRLGAETEGDETTLRLLMERSVRETERLRDEKHTSTPVAGPFQSPIHRDLDVNRN